MCLFFMCLLSHCWSDCLHLQRSGSISVSALLFLPCFECSVDSAAKPWCFISSHVTYSWFFQHSHSNTHSASHTYTQALDNVKCLMLEIFLKHATFAMLIVVFHFRPETWAERQNKQHFGHAQAHTPDKRCTFTLVSPLEWYIIQHISISISIFHVDPFILWTIKCFKSETFFKKKASIFNIMHVDCQQTDPKVKQRIKFRTKFVEM